MATTVKATLTALNMIYFAIVMVLVTFSGVVIFLKISGANVPNEDLDAEVFRYVLYVLTPVGVAGGWLVYRQLLANLDKGLSLRGKLIRLQFALLVRSSIMEVPALLAAVCAFFTFDLLFLAFTAMVVLVMLFLRPTNASIAEDLKLGEKDASLLRSPESLLD